MNLVSPETTLIVIPTYNEAQNIEPLIALVWKICPSIHILVVDDNSQDGTADLVKKVQNVGPAQLFLLQRAGKLGLGTAYLAGFSWALERGYNAVIEMDADFSHDPEALPAMLSRLNEFDAVIGSRYTEGGGTKNWNPFRKLISRFGSLYARLILGVPLHDMTGGFNAWRREVLESIDLPTIRSEGYSFQIELKYRCHKAHKRMIEVPILFCERREGHSKMSWRIVAEAFYRVWTFRLRAQRFAAKKSL